jgi:hypothetical protein
MRKLYNYSLEVCSSESQGKIPRGKPMEKSLSFAGSIASIISLALGFGGGYLVSQSQVVNTGGQSVSLHNPMNVTQSVSPQPVSQNQQVQIVLQQVISDLPPEKRKFAEGVVESFSGVLKAADSSESEMRAAARDFRERISEAALLSYDVGSSPFPLTRQRTVMLCEDIFSVAYQLDESSGWQRFLINGKIHSGVPGMVFEVTEGSKKLRLRYMEYLKGEETAIMSFVCS